MKSICFGDFFLPEHGFGTNSERGDSCGAEASRSTQSSACAPSEAAVSMRVLYVSAAFKSELPPRSCRSRRTVTSHLSTRSFLCASSGWPPLTDLAYLGRPLRERCKRMLASRRACVSVNYFHHCSPSLNVCVCMRACVCVKNPSVYM